MAPDNLLQRLAHSPQIPSQYQPYNTWHILKILWIPTIFPTSHSSFFYTSLLIPHTSTISFEKTYFFLAFNLTPVISLNIHTPEHSPLLSEILLWIWDYLHELDSDPTLTTFDWLESSSNWKNKIVRIKSIDVLTTLIIKTWIISLINAIFTDTQTASSLIDAPSSAVDHVLGADSQ